MIKLAFPKNPFYSKLICDCEDFCRANNIRLYRVSEEDCTNFLLRNLVDCSFLSPLGYGKGVKVTDFRIIPGPMVFVENFSGIASIFFKEGLDTVNSLYSSTSEDFLMLLGRLILSEKFGILLDFQKSSDGVETTINRSDAVIEWGNSSNSTISIDVTEEWFDLTDKGLPLGFWVCRADTYPPNIADVINSIRNKNLSEYEDIIEQTDSTRIDYQRKGKIYWQWKPEFEEALESTLLFLYYHQLLPEIPAVKILGRD